VQPDQFDLERGFWTKPSHHTKQKKIEHTPLSDTALELPRRMHATRTSAALPGQKGARVTIRRPWGQVCKASGIATSEKVPSKRRKFLTIWKTAVRIHDLRQHADFRISRF
jgi:integrase